MRIRDATTTALVSVVIVLVAAAPAAGRKPVPKDLPEPIRQALEAIQTTADDPGPAAARGRPADTAAMIRDSAVARLARMGAKATPAIPFLAGMLEKDHVWQLVMNRARIRTPSISAARALGGIAAAAGAEHLAPVFKHDNWVVRANLVYVLTGVKTPAAINLLGATVGGDREVRVRVMAARALGRLADKAAVKILIAALKDPDPLVRKAAAYSLSIAKEMGNWQIHLVVKALTPLAADKDQGVRQYVAMAFREIGSSNAQRPLRTLLKDPDAAVRYYAADALGVIKDRRAVTALIAALEAEKDPKAMVQLGLVRALGATGDPRATTPLIGCLKHPHEYVRRDAAGALGLIGDRRAVPALIGALNDQKLSVRDSTAAALGLIGDVRALDPLIATLARHKSSAAAVALG
ncbi:MAG: HEAT repeat domain-containing protein, partial [Phycisphaerae bacterium]|nr:HEAT repeat domain-containing protein [Phycisphaerae bacterium]